MLPDFWKRCSYPIPPAPNYYVPVLLYDYTYPLLSFLLPPILNSFIY
jgi:hypothetical protein